MMGPNIAAVPTVELV